MSSSMICIITLESGLKLGACYFMLLLLPSISLFLKFKEKYTLSTQINIPIKHQSDLLYNAQETP